MKQIFNNLTQEIRLIRKNFMSEFREGLFDICPKWLYRFFYKFKTFYRWLKRKPFHIKNGFDYADTWSLDYSLAEWMLPRLKHFRNNFYTVPCKPGGKMTKTGPESLTSKEWRDILDKIIFSFDFVLNEDEYITKHVYPKNYDFGFKTINGQLVWNEKRKPNYDKIKPFEKRYEEGMKLFVKYYRNLWD